MPTKPSSGHKRAVNLTLNEYVVSEAKNYTNNLSATVEELLAVYVVQQQAHRQGRQQQADACADHWNAVNEKIGSFADEHSTL
ncbi:MAG: type II toxin-antitoxin system CcdA family antitoxin [Pseudomonadota bacterium]